MEALLAAYVAKVNAERKMKKRTYPLIQTTDYQLAFRVFVQRLAQRPASGFESSKPTALKISDVKKKTAETRASALEKLNKHDASKKLLYEMRVKPQQDPSEAISNLRNKGLAYGDSMLSNRFRLLEFVEIKKDVGNNVKERNGFYPSRPIVLKPDERKNASKETASASAPQQNESKKDEEKQQEDAMVKKNLLKSLSLVLSNLNRSHLYLLYASLAESSPAISACLKMLSRI